jgi:hypothetical protein
LWATINIYLLLNTFLAIVLFQNGIILVTVSCNDSSYGKAPPGMFEYFSSYLGFLISYFVKEGAWPLKLFLYEAISSDVAPIASSFFSNPYNAP